MERKINAAQKDGGLSRDAAIEEVVADACEMVMGNSKAIERLAKEKPGLAKRIADWLHEFFSDIRKAFEGVEARHEEAKAMLDYMDELAKLWDDALVEAAENRQNSAKGSANFSFDRYADDGRGMYTGDYPKGTPKKAKSADILRYIQTVWSKKPISLRIWDNGSWRTIYAQFDPTYEENTRKYNDATKLMGGNRHGTAAEQRVTLDLASDYYKIASEAKYNYSKPESGKDTEAHKGVKQWHYFVNGIYFAEYGSKDYEPYMVTINVKEKDDGSFVYSFSAEKEKRLTTLETLHAPGRRNENVAANGKPYSNSIRNYEPNVKKSMRDSAEGLTKEEARAQAAAYTRLKAENAELQRRVEYWKGQTQRTKQATVRQSDVNRFARQLIKRYDSTADQSYIRQALQEMGDYLVQNNGEALDFACRSRTRNKVIDTKP